MSRPTQSIQPAAAAPAARYSPVQQSIPQRSIELDDAGFLLQYWNLLWRRRVAIFAAGAATATLALAFSLMMTPMYSAEAMLQIEGFNPGFLGLDQMSAVAAPNGPTNVYLPTQMQILESDSLVAPVAGRLGLAQREEFQGEGLMRRLGRMVGAVSGPPLPPDEVALRKMRKNLSVEPIVQTQLVLVRFRSADPTLAAELPNTLASAFITKNLELRREAGKSTSQWLDEELQSQKSLLREAENKLQSYARRNGLFFTGQAQESIAEDKMRQVQTELLRAEAEAAQAQARFEAAVSNPPETLGEVLSDQALRLKEKELTDLRQELAQAELWFKPNYPRVRELQVQISEVEGSLMRERGNIVHRIENDYRAARRRADLLANELERQTRLVSNESEVAVQYNMFKREVETNRQVYDSLLQRMKDAGVAAAIQNSNISIVDPARVPIEPAEPNVPRNVALGWLLGMGAAIGLVFVRSRVDSTLRSPGDAENRLYLQELGVIPQFVSDAPMRRLLGRKYAAMRVKDDEETAETALDLVCWRREQSALAEAFQTALTSIEHLAHDGGVSPRCIVISSARAGEGKTTVACNLGVAAAQRGQRVLLIDGDLRAGRLHHVFNVDNRWGLSNMLRAGRSEGEPDESLVRPTAVENLFVLPGGSAEANIPKLLSSRRVQELLDSLEQEFDLILIDSPPGLAVADARLLARSSDGVLLVLRSGVTNGDSADAVQRRFQSDGAAVLGAILNGWNSAVDASSWMDDRDYRYYGNSERAASRN
jgi:polysaccharide biosynthesis transport protein